jgi:hypothetical protein
LTIVVSTRNGSRYVGLTYADIVEQMRRGNFGEPVPSLRAYIDLATTRAGWLAEGGVGDGMKPIPKTGNDELDCKAFIAEAVRVGLMSFVEPEA